jgi:asparagine synthase (glutamine-hydrolysing)
LSEARLRRAGYFDPVAVGKLLEKCRAGRALGFSDNMGFVGVLSTMLVDELFIQAPRPNGGAPRTPRSTDLALEN